MVLENYLRMLNFVVQMVSNQASKEKRLSSKAMEMLDTMLQNTCIPMVPNSSEWQNLMAVSYVPKESTLIRCISINKKMVAFWVSMA
jgi:hydroxymethylpyrimidine/phosphomethylpyrimidine kinase